MPCLISCMREGAGRYRRWALVLLGLGLFYLCVRVPHLLALPLFSDEAIYLRWAQLIRQAPWDNLMVSLADPKPPLHYWLMALAWPWGTDPLFGARLVSVGAGLLGTLAMFGLGLELSRMRTTKDDDDTGMWWGIAAVVVATLCPFLAFYQRLATADALFCAQTALIVWLSLRWFRRQAEAGRILWRYVLAVGVLMGACFLTRQILSYALWVVPVTAALWWALPAHNRGRALRTSGVALGAALLLTLVLWAPMLLWGTWHDPIGQWPVIKQRIMYQSHFAAPLSLKERGQLVASNLQMVFVPLTEGHWDYSLWWVNRPGSGWYWLYLTPPVLLLAMVGWVLMLWRRMWGPLVILGLWLGLMLGSFVVMGQVAFSRYSLAGVIPLLVPSGLALVAILRFSRVSNPWLIWARFGLALALFALPMNQLWHQQTNPWMQDQTRRDDYQHLSGWTAGQSVMQAVSWLNMNAAYRPVVIITTDSWGHPADAVWAYLAGQPNVQLYFVSGADRKPVLKSVDGTHYLLKTRKWLDEPEMPVRLDPNVPILFVGPTPLLGLPGEPDAAEIYQSLNPGSGDLMRLRNVSPLGEIYDSGVIILPLALPPATTQP
jgi:4-amino-4-deoxy-L-arabinose transferase-like glycosyltransferase